MFAQDCAYRISRMARDVRLGYSIGEAQDRAAQRHEPVYHAITGTLVEASLNLGRTDDATALIKEALRLAREDAKV